MFLWVSYPLACLPNWKRLAADISSDPQASLTKLKRMMYTAESRSRRTLSSLHVNGQSDPINSPPRQPNNLLTEPQVHQPR